MLRNALIWTLVVALVNSIIGCSYTATIRTEEARLPQDSVAISHVDLHLQIASLQKTDRSWLQLDSSGGRFEAQSGTFVGRATNGHPVQLNLREVKSAMIYQSYPPGETITEISPQAFTRKNGESGVVYTDTVEPAGQRIEFVKRSGRFTEGGQSVTGLSADGRSIVIPTSDITASWTKEKRFSYTRTFLLIGIPVGIVVGLAIALHDMTFMTISGGT
ncbi:MAG: hypothetical protein AB1772_05505 [Candidatus Zixiibacteriota bacterium]